VFIWLNHKMGRMRPEAKKPVSEKTKPNPKGNHPAGVFASFSSTRGQVAIILIFMIAIGLIFYAVSLNVGRVSISKVIATRASNLMAARMGSLMASYGEQVFQEQLDGKEEICGYTSVFQSLMMVAVFVVIIVFAAAAAALVNTVVGAELVTAGQVATAAAVAAVASGISAGIQAAVVEPGITEAWNSIIWENMTIVDQFMEQGIQTGLKNAVTDQVELPDMTDLDGDRIFGGLTDPHDPDTAQDLVSRFGIFYMERVKNTPPPPSLGDFPTCLCALLYVDDRECRYRFNLSVPEYCASPTWGLYDPLKGGDVEVHYPDGPTEIQYTGCGARLDIWDGTHICCPNEAARRDPSNPMHMRFPAMCDPCCQPEFAPCPLPGRKRDILCQIYCDMTDPNPEDPCPVESYCAPRGDEWQCNGGIVPAEGEEPEYGEPVRLAPACCFLDSDERCGVPDTCAQRSYLYTGLPNSSVYPLVFSPYYEDSENNDNPGRWGSFISFREALGLDDFHRDYMVRYGFTYNNLPLSGEYTPNWHRYGGSGSAQTDQYEISMKNISRLVDADRLYGGAPRDIYNTFRLDNEQGLFTIRDTTGFYRPLVPKEDGTPAEPVIYDNPSDQKRGIYPFFYKMADWGIELRMLTYGNDMPVNSPTPYNLPWDHKDDYQCYWCDLVGTPASQSPFHPSQQGCPVGHSEMLDHIDELTYTDPGTGETFRMHLTYAPDETIPGLGQVFEDYDPVSDRDYWCVDRVNPALFEGLRTTIVADSVKNIPDYVVEGLGRGGGSGGGTGALSKAFGPWRSWLDRILGRVRREQVLTYATLFSPGAYKFFNERPFTDPETCANSFGGWRRGLDWYCAENAGAEGYPYMEGCPKHGGYRQCNIDTIVEFYEDGEIDVNRPEETPGNLYDSSQLDCPCEAALLASQTNDDGTDNPYHDSSFQVNATVGNPDDFPEDLLDEMVLEMDAFIEWAERILFIPPKRMRQSIQNWYDEAADWIEPGCLNCKSEPVTLGDGDLQQTFDRGCPDCWSEFRDEKCCCTPKNDSACPGSYTNKSRMGGLWQWKDTLKFFKDPIQDWLTRSYEDPEQDVWCVPPADDECAPGDELATRNADNDDLAALEHEGDVEDVIACLKWQVEDPMESSSCPGVTSPSVIRPQAAPIAIGNAQKFQACHLACELDADDLSRDYRHFAICKDLPRSLDPRVCIVRDPRPANSAGRPIGRNCGFEPPFYEEQWQECYDSLLGTSPDTSNLRALQYALEICEDECGEIRFCPYDEFGYWTGNSYFNSPSLDDILDSLLDILEADAAGLLDPPLTPEQRAQYQQDIIDAVGNMANYGSCADPNFEAAMWDIIDALDDGLNDCDPNEIDGFMEHLRNSEKWAYGQVDKYRYRAWFLQNRVNEAKNAFKTLDDAYFHITNFLIGYQEPAGWHPTPEEPDPRNFPEDPIVDSDLDGDGMFGTEDDNVYNGSDETLGPLPGTDRRLYTEDDLPGNDDMAPAEQLIWSRSNMDKEQEHMPSVAIYVWRDKPIPTDRPPRGVISDGGSGPAEDRLNYVHAVKVEGRIPKRCNYECGVDRWPYVETEEHTLERCYVLAATRGVVKARVIRYDQNPTTYNDPRFPDGTKIWSPRFTHPLVPPAIGGRADNIFDAACNRLRTTVPILKLYNWWDNTIPDGTNPIEDKNFGHAMMLNDIPKPLSFDDEESDYATCWDHVHQLLEEGIASDTCAEYYFGRGGHSIYGKKGFKIRFIRCDSRFLAGES